jgi:hypothetical protein
VIAGFAAFFVVELIAAAFIDGGVAAVVDDICCCCLLLIAVLLVVAAAVVWLGLAVALLLLSLVGTYNIVCACAKFVSIAEELPTKDISMIITLIVAAVEEEIESGINRCNDSILLSVNVIVIY